jgi:iron(III) transport system substrate-binding protein
VNIAINKNAPVKFVVPDECFATYDYYTGLASTARHLAAAKVFLNWNLSKRGQQVFADLGEYSVRSDLAPPNHRIAPDDAIAGAGEDQKAWNNIFGYNE